VTSVSVLIPTQRRPGPLALAARSVLAQAGLDGVALELVIVDNDAAPSARTAAVALADEACFPVRYVHEPRPGVAHARNAAVAASTGEWIAFLDDDEEAPPGWLAALLAAQARFDADVVFGAVRARIPAGVTRLRPYFEQFFSRLGPAAAGVIEVPYGCGDSLVRRAALPHPTAPFALERNEMGGEDDVLFQAMRVAGARFAWSPEAWVWEDPAPERLNLGYTLSRAFAHGQGPTRLALQRTPPDRLGFARWMVIGAGQAVLFGALAVGQAMVRSPRWPHTLSRAVAGLGKLFGWGPFQLRFYGRTVGPRQGRGPGVSTRTPAPG